MGILGSHPSHAKGFHLCKALLNTDSWRSGIPRRSYWAAEEILDGQALQRELQKGRSLWEFLYMVDYLRKSRRSEGKLWCCHFFGNIILLNVTVPIYCNTRENFSHSMPLSSETFLHGWAKRTPVKGCVCIPTLYIQYICICKNPFACMHGTILHSLKQLLLKEVWLHLFCIYFQNSNFILEGCS